MHFTHTYSFMKSEKSTKKSKKNHKSIKIVPYKESSDDPGDSDVTEIQNKDGSGNVDGVSMTIETDYEQIIIDNAKVNIIRKKNLDKIEKTEKMIITRGPSGPCYIGKAEIHKNTSYSVNKKGMKIFDIKNGKLKYNVNGFEFSIE